MEMNFAITEPGIRAESQTCSGVFWWWIVATENTS